MLDTVAATTHLWWETVFGWSPTVSGIFNGLLHPIELIVGGQVGLSLMSILIMIWLCQMRRQLIRLYEINKNERRVKDKLNEELLNRKPVDLEYMSMDKV